MSTVSDRSEKGDKLSGKTICQIPSPFGGGEWDYLFEIFCFVFVSARIAMRAEREREESEYSGSEKRA